MSTPKCNLKINNEEYYTESDTILKNILSIAYRMFKIGTICCCCCCLLIIFFILMSNSNTIGYVITGIIILLSLVSMIYDAYLINSAKTEMANIKNDPKSRPCLDASGNIVS